MIERLICPGNNLFCRFTPGRIIHRHANSQGNLDGAFPRTNVRTLQIAADTLTDAYLQLGLRRRETARRLQGGKHNYKNFKEFLHVKWSRIGCKR